MVIIISLILTLHSFALSSAPTASVSSIPHTYKVLPGTDEWVKMTPEQRLASCKVTKSEVEAMTTAALVETVVNYPYLINMYAYDSVELGIDQVSNHFPGIKELLSRSDSYEKLSAYVDSATESGKSVESDVDFYNAIKLSSYLLFKKNPDSYTPLRTDLPPMTSVQTPTNKSVDVYYNVTWDHIAGWYFQEYGDVNGNSAQQYANVDNNLWISAFPNATMISGISPVFNCFSYAFYSQSVNNPYWMPDISTYFEDDCYIYTASPVYGNKVTYASANGYISHAGCVSGQSGSTVMITSKWTYGGLFIHPVYDCPFYIDYPSSVRYWARNLNV